MAGQGKDARELSPRRPSPSGLPEYRLRPSSVGGVSQQVEASPAYVIEWNADGSRRTLLAGVEELRSEIEHGKRDHVQRLFVLHGLPAEYIKALRSSLDIDPAFIEAHAARRRYRPLRWRKDATFVHYEYPELVRGYQASTSGATNKEEHESAVSKSLSAIDFMPAPDVKPITENGDTAAVFCHASLWVTSQADVLFLDRPIWRDPSSPLRKARRVSSVTKPYQVRPGSSGETANLWDVELAGGEEIAALEDTLIEALKDAADIGDALVDLVSDIAYDHWLDFFETLTPHSQRSPEDTMQFYWHTLQSVEQNIDVSNFLGRQQQKTGIGYPDWQVIQARVKHRIDLARAGPVRIRSPPALPGQTTSIVQRTNPPKFSRDASRAQTWSQVSNKTGKNSTGRNSAGPPAESENKRALDRVSYIGGVVLPFSIVSGILGMSDPFSPTGNLFWIFWAVSIPLASITLFIIYADTIRKVEVWVEVAASAVVAATTEGEGNQEKQQQPVGMDTITEQRETTTWRRAVPFAGEQPFVQQSVLYTVGQEEQLIDMPHAASMPVEQDSDDTGMPPDDGKWAILDSSSGPKPKAWKRQPLGWYGAVKTIMRYSKPRSAEEWVPNGVLAYERPQPTKAAAESRDGGRKTRTM